MTPDYDEEAREHCTVNSCGKRGPPPEGYVCVHCSSLARTLRKAHAAGEAPWKARAEALWQLLDDIDTLGDAAKGDKEAYVRGVKRLHVVRWEFADSDGYVLAWKPIVDRSPDTAGSTMARVLNSMRTDEAVDALEEGDG